MIQLSQYSWFPGSRYSLQATKELYKHNKYKHKTGKYKFTSCIFKRTLLIFVFFRNTTLTKMQNCQQYSRKLPIDTH